MRSKKYYGDYVIDLMQSVSAYLPYAPVLEQVWETFETEGYIEENDRLNLIAIQQEFVVY